MILDKVKNTIKKYNLIKKNDRIVIGVSGGPDSVTLLYLLKTLSKELNLKLHIAHLDHMLRKDSYKDRKFVEGLANRLKLPITSDQINVGELTKKGSLEEIARNRRFRFLFKVADDSKADKIALGHNLDDQAETVLMRILRGTGLYGLIGILPKRNLSGYQIIRPLIEVRRKEIDLYLKKKGIQARQDPSNKKEIYFRNKIRKRLLPLLEKEYNKNIKEVLSHMAGSIGYDYDFLSLKTDAIMKKLRKKINLSKFSRLHPAIQRLVLRSMILKLKGDTRRVTFRHIIEIEDLILNRPINSIVDLPKGISVIKGQNNITFFPRKKAINA